MRPPDWFKKMTIPLANKIVYASDAYVGLKSSINDMSHTLIDFSQAPAGPADHRLHEFAQLIRPWTCDGLELIRVGADHDGGYLMANDFDVAGAISIGIGPDVSWDRDVASRGIPVVMFDPTIRRPPDRVEGTRFVNVGLGSTASSGSYRPLGQLVGLAGMSCSDDLLLKIDVEGAEWEALAGLAPSDLAPFSQIVLEMHDLDRLKDCQYSEQILQTVRIIRSGHLSVHVHANNFESLTRFDRNWFPKAIEVSFLRLEKVRNPKCAVRVYDSRDAPCDARVREISLEALASLQEYD